MKTDFFINFLLVVCEKNISTLVSFHTFCFYFTSNVSIFSIILKSSLSSPWNYFTTAQNENFVRIWEPHDFETKGLAGDCRCVSRPVLARLWVPAKEAFEKQLEKKRRHWWWMQLRCQKPSARVMNQGSFARSSERPCYRFQTSIHFFTYKFNLISNLWNHSLHKVELFPL